MTLAYGVVKESGRNWEIDQPVYKDVWPELSIVLAVMCFLIFLHFKYWRKK